MSFVKILVTDEEGRHLEHFFVRKQMWGLPAGKVEDGEALVDAARRELLERTGFSVEESQLVQKPDEGEFALFVTEKKFLTKVAEPGERGGYVTMIRWV